MKLTPGITARLLAVLTTLLSYPFAGAGLYILGRGRRCLFWVGAGAFLSAAILAAVRAKQPKVFLISFALVGIVLVGSLVDTCIAKPGKLRSLGLSLLAVLLILIGVRLVNFAVKRTLVEAYKLPAESMAPTLLAGDSIMIKKTRSVRRGDVIVFRFPRDRRTDYVKRVVAVGGDVLAIRRGMPSINGVPLAQEVIPDACPAPDEPNELMGACRLLLENVDGRSYTIMQEEGGQGPDFGPVTVPEGQVFVLGDNRDNSHDSRSWGGVPSDDIEGTVSFTFWSTDRQTGTRWHRVGRVVD